MEWDVPNLTWWCYNNIIVFVLLMIFIFIFFSKIITFFNYQNNNF